MSNALPTNVLAIEPWLRALATPAELERNPYAFLFGMATVKLAEAHREIERLQGALNRAKFGRDAVELLEARDAD